MIENIVIRKAVTEEERSLFWERLRAYFCRDIFPDPEDEDRPYFLGDDYRRTMESLRTRPVHPVHWLAFSRNGQDVGFALAAVFTGEDGKCFILEFCVLPEQRNGHGLRPDAAELGPGTGGRIRGAELHHTAAAALLGPTGLCGQRGR